MKEQRDQLYRKLDLLKSQGIEILGPNMSVLKTEPVNAGGSGPGGGPAGHPQGPAGSSAAEMLYYREVGAAESKSQNASPTGKTSEESAM